MAGIGFSLKRLFGQKGLFNLCKAYGYAGIVTVGPMLLGVLLLAGMALVARMGDMSPKDSNLLNCMLTYGLLASLFVTTWFSMGVTRYVSDMLYEGDGSKVMPSFFGVTVIQLVITVVVYGGFLAFSGVSLVRIILCLWFAMVLTVVWTEMIYLTALRDFQSIVLSFAICLMAGFVLALVMILIGWVTVESLLLCMIVAYGLLAFRQLQLMLDYFPKSEGSKFSFLRWFSRYSNLVLAGGFLRIGLFSHLIIMYFGPLAQQVEGLFYMAPEHDLPALIAFFSLLITTVSFVTSVEVNFYPKYSNYYGLFNDRGAIKDIELAESEMRSVLEREMTYLGYKQIFTTLIAIVLVAPLLKKLFPGFSSLSVSIFRFLCAGYGAYALANSLMLICLYFEDYVGAVWGTGIFAVISTAATIWQINFGRPEFFGLGFFLGSILFFFFMLFRLGWYTKRLAYFLLANQNLVPNTEHGFFADISNRLDWWQKQRREEREKERTEAAKRKLEEEGLRP
jgi:uncharacterized membrane protein